MVSFVCKFSVKAGKDLPAYERSALMKPVRKGTSADIPQIVRIYGHILDAEEQGRATVGWIRGVYPTEQTALRTLEAGELFVMMEGAEVAAAAVINKNQVPVYAEVPWQDCEAPEEQVMVLHTLVVDPAFSGKGLGTAFVEFYERYALERGCPYLRMDTNARNQAARQLYHHLGYREAGIVPCVFNGIEGVQLVCLEKRLEQ